MTDKDNMLIEDFFKQAAQQQIEDNGFTERVMTAIERSAMPLGSAQNSQLAIGYSRLFTKLWTLFCVIVGVALFFVLGGMEALKSSILIVLQTVLTSLSVFFTTAPTTEVPVDPVVMLLLLA